MTSSWRGVRALQAAIAAIAQAHCSPSMALCFPIGSLGPRSDLLLLALTPPSRMHEMANDGRGSEPTWKRWIAGEWHG